MSFSGFSEDDIKKITKGPDPNRHEKGVQKQPAKRVTFKSNNTKTTTSKYKNASTVNGSNPVTELPDNAKLTPILPQEPTELPPPNAVIEEAPQCIKPEKKFKDLSEFEARQKLIEEQNRKRKELLAKALADRTKQTQEEAQRLNEIQEEFKKLDAMLSNDVKILRKQIEAASLDYTECQKRYHKIEKEFLEAKVLLHQKLEKKEMLTEHLCAIIEKNEERKADKLTELLQKLQINTPPEDNCPASPE